MELTKEMKIGIGVAVAAIGGFVIHKVLKNAKDKSDAVAPITPAPAPAAFKIDDFLNGTWKGGWEVIDKNNASYGQKGHDWYLFKGNDIYWIAGTGGTTTPEFTITSKTYDDATGKLIMNYKRNSNTETWTDDLVVDKKAKTMKGTQNDGAIALDYTKSDGVVAKKYEGKNVTNGTEKDKVENGALRWYNGDKWDALSSADKSAVVTITAAEFDAIPRGKDM